MLEYCVDRFRHQFVTVQSRPGTRQLTKILQMGWWIRGTGARQVGSFPSSCDKVECIVECLRWMFDHYSVNVETARQLDKLDSSTRSTARHARQLVTLCSIPLGVSLSFRIEAAA